MNRPRKLIVNGDELGQSLAMNVGIENAQQKGILTQASLLLRHPATKQAIASAQEKHLALGLHLNVTDGKPITSPQKIPTLTNKQGIFLQPKKMSRRQWDQFAGSLNPAEVYLELRAQLNEFKRLTGNMPTHLDSHRVMSGYPSLLPSFVRLAHEFDLPLRLAAWHHAEWAWRITGQKFFVLKVKEYPHKIKSSDYLIFMTDIRLKGFAELAWTLRNLREGITELVTHPAQPALPLAKKYNKRLLDFQLISDPRTKKILEQNNIQLTSFQQEFS